MLMLGFKGSTQHIRLTQAPGDTWRDSTERLHPEVQTLIPFYIPFLTEKEFLSFTFYRQTIPLSHTNLQQFKNCCECTVFYKQTNKPLNQEVCPLKICVHLSALLVVKPVKGTPYRPLQRVPLPPVPHPEQTKSSELEKQKRLSSIPS